MQQGLGTTMPKNITLEQIVSLYLLEMKFAWHRCFPVTSYMSLTLSKFTIFLRVTNTLTNEYKQTGGCHFPTHNECTHVRGMVWQNISPNSLTSLAVCDHRSTSAAISVRGSPTNDMLYAPFQNEAKERAGDFQEYAAVLNQGYVT